MRQVKLFPLEWLLFTLPALLGAQEPMAITWKNLEVTLGPPAGAPQIKRTLVIDFGGVEGMPFTLALEPAQCSEHSSQRSPMEVPSARRAPILTFRLVGMDSAEIELTSFGSKVKIRVGPPWAVVDGRVVLKRDKPVDLLLDVDFRLGDIYDLNGITVSNKGAPVMSLVLAYVILPAMLAVERNSGPLPSGKGVAFSAYRADATGYKLTLGETPYPYRLARVCYWLEGDRHCGAYSQCTLTKADDSNVELEFKLQGHEEDHSSRKSEAHLYADYILKPSVVVLR